MANKDSDVIKMLADQYMVIGEAMCKGAAPGTTVDEVGGAPLASVDREPGTPSSQ